MLFPALGGLLGGGTAWLFARRGNQGVADVMEAVALGRGRPRLQHAIGPALGSVLATSAMGLSNDVYFKVGLITIIGLAAKNAILIVQFAKDRVEEGMGLIEATLEAAKLRLRPIVMTSLAFGFGVLPLALANGAGAGAQRAIGIAVVGGVATSTFLVTLFAPLFYVTIQKTFGKRKPQPAPANAAPPSTGEH